MMSGPAVPVDALPVPAAILRLAAPIPKWPGARGRF
jgi:hypothetical protein